MKLAKSRNKHVILQEGLESSPNHNNKEDKGDVEYEQVAMCKTKFDFLEYFPVIFDIFQSGPMLFSWAVTTLFG